MYNPTAAFWWGAACGAGIVLSALLTLQMIRRYNELSPFGRPRHNEFNLRGVVTFGFSMLALLFIAIYTRCPPAALHFISDGSLASSWASPPCSPSAGCGGAVA